MKIEKSNVVRERACASRMSVVCTEYDSRSAKLRRTVKLVEQSVITSATLSPFVFSSSASIPRTNASGICFGVCNRPKIRSVSIHIESRVRSYYIIYYTTNNNSVDLGRNVGGEATNLSKVNFEARFSMHGNWCARVLRSRLYYIDS